MKAIGFKASLPIEESESFILFEKEKPIPENRDLLVKIDAVSVNPVDFKIRQNSAKDIILNEPKIIGWDAVGIVESVGDEVSIFQKGDRVFYAGDINKPGTNAEYQLIDERIVGYAPKTTSTAEAAAMPLTSLTAWELLFDRVRISKEKDQGKSILIIGGAGGVGSIATQIAKRLAGLTVIATASRKETKAWCLKNGADYIVNPHDLVIEVRKIGFDHVDFIIDLVDIQSYWDIMVELIKPQGHIGSITGTPKLFWQKAFVRKAKDIGSITGIPEPVALTKLKSKSVSVFLGIDVHSLYVPN